MTTTTPTFHQPPSIEGRRTVTSAEAAPASSAESVDCMAWRTAHIIIDALDAVTAGTLSIYLATDAADVPQLAEEVAFPAAPVTRLDVRYRVDALARLSARVTSLTGTSCRVTVRLTQEEAT